MCTSRIARLWTFIGTLVTLQLVVFCRIHHLSLTDDIRQLIPISTFGFYKRGSLQVTIHNLRMKPQTNEPFGFTVDRTATDGMNPYSRNIENECVFTTNRDDETLGSIKFQIDIKNNRTVTKCSNDLHSGIRISKMKPQFSIPAPVRKISSDFTNPMTQKLKRNGTDEQRNYFDDDGDDDESSLLESGAGTESDIAAQDNSQNFPVSGGDVVAKPAGLAGSSSSSPVSASSVENSIDNEIDSGPQSNSGAKQSDMIKDSLDPQSNPVLDNDDSSGTCDKKTIYLNSTRLPDGTISYSMAFVISIEGEGGEGLYNLYFHSCAESLSSRVTLNMSIIEENDDTDGKNYLSAGEMPLPALYFMMSVMFFTAGCFWVVVLKKSRKETGVMVFKIHYLMTALVFAKSLSLFFHSMNYHYIQVYGTHVEGWAVLYYITHLVKGALLFITILLIGTGYAFVKHLLSEKEKKLFMIVIPLQVLANVAQIIIEESEQGEIVHTTWNFIFITVDLLCCGAILFPVVWSIRHLQEASQTDGKAASNLRKLKLFRHFYIMVVCYIYFTRIIVQLLLRITVPFKYEWVDDMFREMTTFIFFVLTGYKFRPAFNNPYLELAHDSDDEADMDIALTESGLTSGLSKRGFKPKKKTLKEIVLFDPNDDGSDDDEEVLLEKREASHDFD